jgi:hypothetical protein
VKMWRVSIAIGWGCWMADSVSTLSRKARASVRREPRGTGHRAGDGADLPPRSTARCF